ncbi:helix-turn-helix domain-containing protein [Streptacidiphilus sp. ASG 303]|uniref:winged helix-turn-helix transcriptional regulator n=1 Tax=Streptacidiphilus sp. ASG 303 TaxID=2896847 RepID=UPI00272D54CA|nr:helix-turn-helix domain-containing protein [Streptacidiphilus sp. ASG 303]
METDAMRLEGALADRDAWTADRCSLDRAVQAVGSRSALLLMREAFYGTRRFDDFARRVGITEAVTASRLRELVAAGLLERHPYREPGRRTRQEYVLTERGRDLLPVALAFMRWGDRHLSGPEGPPVRLTHHGCGAPVQVHVCCDAGHELAVDEVAAAPGGRDRPEDGDDGDGRGADTGGNGGAGGDGGGERPAR